jgi:hypothetical protein
MKMPTSGSNVCHGFLRLRGQRNLEKDLNEKSK